MKIHVKFEREKYYWELSCKLIHIEGPVWAWSTVQKSVLPTLGDSPAKLGYFKIVCCGLKKKMLGGRPNIGLLWSRLSWAKMPIFRCSALKFWQHWHESWSNHNWQHGFSIRDAITDLFTNRQFFYHLNSTSSSQPKVRTYHPSKVRFSIFWPQSHASVNKIKS